MKTIKVMKNQCVMNVGMKGRASVMDFKPLNIPSSHVLRTQFMFVEVVSNVIMENINKNADAPAQEYL